MDMLLSFGKAQPGSKDLSQNSKGERRRARNASPPGGALVSNWALKSQSVFNRAMIMPQANDSALLAPVSGRRAFHLGESRPLHPADASPVNAKAVLATFTALAALQFLCVIILGAFHA
ncbi:hypothetical protein ACVWWO_006983 [Bradyrhizobium sp. F1.13.1]